MHRHIDRERTAYYRRQACACAAAAAAAAEPDVKDAYVNLEQGWLCLAPKADATASSRHHPVPVGLADSKRPQSTEAKPTKTASHTPRRSVKRASAQMPLLESPRNQRLANEPIVQPTAGNRRGEGRSSHVSTAAEA
jgi:hypothetical protein